MTVALPKALTFERKARKGRDRKGLVAALAGRLRFASGAAFFVVNRRRQSGFCCRNPVHFTFLHKLEVSNRMCGDHRVLGILTC
jgi:hypothetical protein